MSPPKGSWKHYFLFNHRERRGVITLLALLLLVSGFRMALPHVLTSDPISITLDTLEIHRVEKHWYEKEKLTERSLSELPIEFFHFNPNELESTGWHRLGFTQAQAASIISYREKGGVFRIKKDILKMYVVSDEKYRELEPWIDLPHSLESGFSSVERFNQFENESIGLHPIELNSADTTLLKSLKGIGPYYAQKIVDYREELGGYKDVNQLMEIWRFSAETLEHNRSRLTIDSTLISKVDINQCSAEELSSHPYIDFNLSRALVNYRQSHGKYENVDEIKSCHLVSDSIFDRLKHYLVAHDLRKDE